MSFRLSHGLFLLEVFQVNEPTIYDMYHFLLKWSCICGTCILCEACFQVDKKIKEEEEE